MTFPAMRSGEYCEMKKWTPTMFRELRVRNYRIIRQVSFLPWNLSNRLLSTWIWEHIYCLLTNTHSHAKLFRIFTTIMTEQLKTTHNTSTLVPSTFCGLPTEKELKECDKREIASLSSSRLNRGDRKIFKCLKSFLKLKDNFCRKMFYVQFTSKLFEH